MKPGLSAFNSLVRNRDHTIKVVFCWTEVSGYMAACWRALSARPGIDVHVLHLKQLADRPNPFLSEPRLLGGISNQIVADVPDVDRWLVQTIASRRPDVMVVCGWLHRPYTRLANAKELERVRVVLGMDSPWRGSVSQRLAKFRLSKLVGRSDVVITAGSRSAEYAKRLGVPDHRIRNGYYGFDYERFSKIACARPKTVGEWPRQFLFVGRYVPAKDLDTLIKAYSLYRDGVSQPWGLTCCGAGVDRGLLEAVPGVVDAGFTSPNDLPAVFARHGAFVLASRFEPWGVVIAEAAASGMPLICTTACGAAVDIVRAYFNGLLVLPQDVEGLARAMRWIHDHEPELPVIGRRGMALAEAYSADAWATRWHHYLQEAVDAPRSPLG